MERYNIFLATTGSVTPFIGLFGTVWLARDMAERHIAELASRTGMEGEASGAIGA